MADAARQATDGAPALAEKDDYYRDILEGLALYLDSPIVANILEAVVRFPNPDLGNALNRNQIASKSWLIEELRAVSGPNPGTVFVLGGWYGVLGAMLLDDRGLRVDRVVSVDIDPGCAPVAECLNGVHAATGRFVAVTADIVDIDYSRAPLHVFSRSDDGETVLNALPDIVICTSCEHLARFAEWYARIPGGTLLALQSNDYTALSEHVNCVADLAAFRRQAPMAEVLYAGERAFKRCTRFMLIGRK